MSKQCPESHPGEAGGSVRQTSRLLRLNRSWLGARALTVLCTFAIVVAATAVTQAGQGQSVSKGLSLPAAATTRTARPADAGARPSMGSRLMTVVGVGDSVTSGFNCGCESFVGLYANGLATQRQQRTSWVNLGVPGLTSAQLLNGLTHPGTDRDEVAKADILLVTIGANDLESLESAQPADCPAACYNPMVANVGHNVELIVKAARAVRPAQPPTVLVTDYWNVFQDGDVGTAERGAAFQNWSDALTRAQSTQICRGARRAGAICVSLYAKFKGDGSVNPTSLLAADGDHPNAAGHRVIASALLGATPQPPS